MTDGPAWDQLGDNDPGEPAIVVLRRVVAPALLAGAIAACAGSSTGGGGGDPPARRTEETLPAKSIEEVLAAHTDSLMALPGVVGTAIGLCEGERCIKVFLAEPNPATMRGIPGRLETYRVSVEVTGTIRPR